MTDPPRLVEAPDSELEAALLEAGRSYRATDHTRARALAALGLVGTSVVATQSSAAGFSVAKSWIIAGIVAAAGAAGIGAVVLREAAPRPAVAVQPMAALPVAVTDRPLPVVTAPEPAASSQPAPSPVRSTVPMPSLTEELASLDRASRALRGGDGAGALRLLDDHARKFPRARLGLEAEVLRIEALATAGNRAGASSLARGFLGRHPKSVLAPRVERYAH